MKIVDAHQHFWKYDPVNYAWIDDSMRNIRRDFLPGHLAEVLISNLVDSCVAVQADQSETETNWLLQLAEEHAFIAGVVGWVDLLHPQLEERLQHYKRFPKLKGFRHVLQGEEPSFMLQPSFLQGIGKLNPFGFTYDLLIYPHHLEAALQLVSLFPEQPFVIDHLAKPYIKKGEIEEWKTGMEKLAANQNVYCKISGMVTEANWDNWTAQDLYPYLDAVVDSFGDHRLLFGSDWPVCLVASTYEKWMQVLHEYFEPFAPAERARIFGGNAKAFYSL